MSLFHYLAVTTLILAALIPVMWLFLPMAHRVISWWELRSKKYLTYYHPSPLEGFKLPSYPNYLWITKKFGFCWLVTTDPDQTGGSKWRGVHVGRIIVLVAATSPIPTSKDSWLNSGLWGSTQRELSPTEKQHGGSEVSSTGGVNHGTSTEPCESSTPADRLRRLSETPMTLSIDDECKSPK